MAGIQGEKGKFKPLSDEPMAERALSVRVARDVDEAVRAVPDRASWLRRVITEAARRELMGEPNDAA
jgi:hypothetical protein